MKKILSVLFFLFSFFLLFRNSTFAQIPQQSTAIPTQPMSVRTAYPLNTDPNVPQNFHTYSQNVFIELLTNISCVLTGYDPLNQNGKCLGINPATHKVGYVESQGGAIGIVGNMISMTFDIPVSSTTYMKDLASNFGITKTGYAALTDGTDGNGTSTNTSLGYGYNGLKPVLNVWKLFRNLVYLILVLLFIVIGLGIMFRINMDARSVMTIQNQLPKIIIGILLVTFSYAIAGFIVDMMYVFMYLIYYIFTQQMLGTDMGGLNPSYLQGTSPLGAIGGLGGAGSIAFDAAKPFGNIIASLFDNNFGRMISGIVGGIIGAGAGSMIPVVGTVIGGVAGVVAGGVIGSKILGVVGGLIAFIVMTIAILWAMLRLWFLLLRSFIFFLVDVILAPFWIGLGLIPKGGAGFNSWIRDIVANLAVFPATLFILLLGKILVTEFSSSASSNSFVPPLIGNPGDVSSFGAIIGLGIILLLPGVVTMVRDTLKAPGFKYTQQIGQSIGVGTGFAKQGGGWVKGNLWKDDKQTGKPMGLKKAIFDRVGHNYGGFLQKGRIGKGFAKIGSKLPIKPLQKRAKQFQANQSFDVAPKQEKGLPTSDPNRGNTVKGRDAWLSGNGEEVLIKSANGEIIRRPASEVEWDQKKPDDQNPAAGTPHIETNPAAGATTKSAVDTALDSIASGEGTENLTEEDLNKIGIKLREALRAEGHNLSTNTLPENVAESARRLRPNIVNEILSAKRTNLGATEPSNGPTDGDSGGGQPPTT